MERQRWVSCQLLVPTDTRCAAIQQQQVQQVTQLLGTFDSLEHTANERIKQQWTQALNQLVLSLAQLSVLWKV
jgi:hypothetical protein